MLNDSNLDEINDFYENIIDNYLENFLANDCEDFKEDLYNYCADFSDFEINEKSKNTYKNLNLNSENKR